MDSAHGLGISLVFWLRNGVVTLTGKASSATALALATKFVNDANGVKSVNIKMTIEQVGAKVNQTAQPHCRLTLQGHCRRWVRSQPTEFLLKQPRTLYGK